MNTKIAICDDEPHQSEYIKSLINKWADKNNIKAVINIFESAEAFKAKWKTHNYAMLLLDIQMEGQNGIELAKELRLTDDKLIITFITALPDYIHIGYDVAAMHYLIKPINEDKLYDILSRAYQSISDADRFMMVNSNGRDCLILYKDILYIEAFRNYISIVTSDSQYEVKENISHIEHELDDSFFRCQRSYIVSLKHIKYISKTEVELNNGVKISLSRNIYNDLYRAFINYHKKERKSI